LGEQKSARDFEQDILREWVKTNTASPFNSLPVFLSAIPDRDIAVYSDMLK
jgi:hypothetical protein